MTERGSDDHIRQLIQASIDAAFQSQVVHLFTNWMKDDTDQPARAATGLRKAVRAYRRAIAGIENEKL